MKFYNVTLRRRGRTEFKSFSIIVYAKNVDDCRRKVNRMFRFHYVILNMKWMKFVGVIDMGANSYLAEINRGVNSTYIIRAYGDNDIDCIHKLQQYMGDETRIVTIQLEKENFEWVE